MHKKEFSKVSKTNPNFGKKQKKYFSFFTQNGCNNFDKNLVKYIAA